MTTAADSPKLMPDWAGIALVALSAILMAYSARIGAAGLALFYVLWMPLYVLRRDLIFRAGRGIIPLFLLPLYCLYTTLWSDYPGQTLYFGIQFMVLTLCALALARTVSTMALAKGLTLGISLILLASVASGQQHVDANSGERFLVGLFSSKNQLGLIAALGIVISSVLLFGRAPLAQRILLTAPCTLLGLYALYASKSMTSVMSLAVTLGLLASAYVITRLKGSLRIALLVLGGFALLTGYTALSALEVSIADSTLSSVGKDTTLTGRTVLWEGGLKIAMERPLLGHGYSAFWVHGQPQAEQYWKMFNIIDRGGFHFHSMYVQSLVDLGLVGTALLVGLIILTLWYSIRRALAHGMDLPYSLPLALAFLQVARSFFEVDFFGNNSVSSLLFFMLLPLMLRPESVEKKD